MSPLVWDLAHIGNQEELWLVRDVGGREPLRPEIDELYDAFQHPRADRADAAAARARPRPARYVGRGARTRSLDVLGRAARWTGRRLVDDGFAFGMIVQHEQQHDETMLATHQLRRGRAGARPRPPPPPGAPLPAGRGAGARAGRSRWAPRPSRGRWTTSGPRTASTCRAF